MKPWILAWIACIFIASPCVAAVATVEVTIKSVNADSRSITVLYESGSGQKATDLDVARRAEITINGKPAALDTLGAGSRAKVSYDKDLAIVTRIEATATQSDAKDQPVVNLLSLVAAPRKTRGKLLMEGKGQPPTDHLTLPYEPAVEYDLTLEFKTSYKDGQSDTIIFLPSENGSHSFCIRKKEDATQLFLFGDQTKRKKNQGPAPVTTSISPGLESGRRYNLRLEVRKDGLKAYLDEKLRFGLDSYEGLGTNPDRTIGILISNNRTEITALDLKEITGKGKRVPVKR
jgi:hypothetical protein